MEGGTIADLEIKGDFLIPNQEELMRVIQTIKGRRVDTISSIVESSRLPTDIKKSLIGLLKNISTKGVSDGTS